MDNVKNQCLLK